MPDILAENLSDKEVMGSDGSSLGTLYNITMDLKTGTLQHLILDPGQQTGELEFKRDEAGNYRIPVGRVQAVKDTIIIDR
ncbi:MAG: PRC-barrel domain-containing protein [Natronomonas sp.]|jgi:sporulation protein YlmC with PRC-barrel domain|uniref:Photosystem reaction center subunit H n=1 Tax=Natronomonas salsuginis TaxID=2217661 RepID=A0A4U5JBR4_9EURY|nr:MULTISPECIES: PRC-barrel domain-containing protein [Natronomonas]MDR9382178.1 PRC-barrel domain-containing protein [Natronomonas sp.]MDR9431427.1 PRC-barrel domain-containing protein [Natronomonas sp.]TKR26294.1 photosystem reaction center subunit H [Natronomonas salsuginis]